MLKKIVSIVLVSLLVLSLAACQSKPKEAPKPEEKKPVAQPTAVDKIKQAGKLVLGTESTFPPYEGIDKDGKTIVGFDIDLGQAIAKKLGVTLEVKDIKFDGLIPSLMGDKIDIILAGMSVNEERKQSVDFSDIYYTGLQVLVVKEDSSMKTAADMNGKKIGAQLGTTSEKAAKGIAGITLKALDKVDQLMLSVKNGQLDGVVVDDTVGVEYVKSIKGLKIVKVAEINIGESGMGVAVKKGNKELLQIVNDTIKELKSNGEFDKLVDKWGLLK